MKIEHIQVSLRERNPWQAIDLGFNISRHYSAMLYKSYLLGLLMFGVPIVIILHNYPSWAGLLIWYIKPLFEVGPQVLLSQKIFGENFSNKQIAKITFNSIKKHWWPSITYLRFSVRRSFIMPVFLLEGLTTKARRNRLATLSLGQSQGPTSLTILLAHCEMLFYFVLLFIIYQFIPVYERIDPFVIFKPESQSLWFQWVTLCCWLISITLVAPFYLSSGFTLYLNKRIELEGWDLELSFKKIKNRLIQHGSTLSSLLLILLFNFPDRLHAETPMPQPVKQKPVEVMPIERDQTIPTMSDLLNKKNKVKSKENDKLKNKEKVIKATSNDTIADDITENNKPFIKKIEPTEIKKPAVLDDAINKQTQQEITHILNTEPLVRIQEKSVWKWKSNSTDDKQTSDTATDSNFKGVSFILEILLWAGIAGIVLWLIMQLPHFKGLSEKRIRGTKIKRQAEVFGVVLEQQDLEHDLSRLINDAFKKNDFRKVLALLLASALGEMSHHSSRKIPRGATELDCLQIATKINMDKIWLNWFESLLQLWVFLAWGHKNISKSQIEQILRDAPLDELQSSSGEQNA